MPTMPCMLPADSGVLARPGRQRRDADCRQHRRHHQDCDTSRIAPLGPEDESPGDDQHRQRGQSQNHRDQALGGEDRARPGGRREDPRQGSVAAFLEKAQQADLGREQEEEHRHPGDGRGGAVELAHTGGDVGEIDQGRARARRSQRGSQWQGPPPMARAVATFNPI